MKNNDEYRINHFWCNNMSAYDIWKNALNTLIDLKIKRCGGKISVHEFNRAVWNYHCRVMNFYNLKMNECADGDDSCLVPNEVTRVGSIHEINIFDEYDNFQLGFCCIFDDADKLDDDIRVECIDHEIERASAIDRTIRIVMNYI